MAKAKKSKKSTVKSKSQSVPQVVKHSIYTNRVAHCIAIFIIGCLLYANTLTHKYTQDDAIVIYDNMFTTKGIAGIPGILSYDTFYGFFKEEGKANLVSGGRYRPLTLVMFAIEYSIFGESPMIGHLVNILLFALTSVLVYLLILKLLLPRKDPEFAYFVAFVTALLFVVHPIHTEAVANIKGRDEILTLFGSLLAVYFSLKAFYEDKSHYAIIAGLVFFLSLFSKENAITFLAIVPIAFYLFTDAKVPQIIKQLSPYIAATVLFMIIRGIVIGWQFGGTPQELMNNPYLKIQGNQYVPFTFAEKSATICFTLGKYIQLLFFPHPLTHDYYPRAIEIMNWSNWKVILSLLTYLFLIGYSIIGLLRKDYLAFGLIFFLATLSIVSNVVFPIGTNMAERFIFMPSVGFCFVIAILLYRLSAFMKKSKQISFQQLFPGMAVVGIISLLFTIKTITRNTVWKDNYTLFTTDAKTSTRSAKLLNAVGGELTTLAADESNEVKRKQMLTEGVTYLNNALKIHPNYKNTYLLLGNAYNYLEQYENSISSYNRAIKLDPNYKDAKNNLGITYRNAGRFYGEKKGDMQKALQYLNEAYKLRPDEYETVRLLGVAYGVKGDNAKAIQNFERAVKLQPNNADALFNLASAYFHSGNEPKGNEYRQKALAIDPNIESQRNNRNQ